MPSSVANAVVKQLVGDLVQRSPSRLNVANVDRMGWLPANRVWRPGQTNSSGSDTIDIVALEHPEIPGYLAAQLCGVYVEFRMSHSWDTGIGHPAVLLHVMHDPNSHILPSDAANYVNEWQPGQAYGLSLVQLTVVGGLRIEVISYNLPARNAQNRHVDIPAPLSQYLACLVSPKTNSPSPAQRLVPVGAQKAISY
jgi:hypothetical protein